MLKFWDRLFEYRNLQLNSRARRRSLGKIHNDDNAKASFALAGVLILLLVNINVVYIVSVNNDYRSGMIENREIERMNAAINKAHIEVQTAAYYKVLSAIRETKHHPERSLDIVFNDSFKTYIGDNFPRTIRDCEVSVDDYYTLITPVSYDQTTITPSYTLEGHFNYTAKHKDSAITLGKNMTFDRDIY